MVKCGGEKLLITCFFPLTDFYVCGHACKSFICHNAKTITVLSMTLLPLSDHGSELQYGLLDNYVRLIKLTYLITRPGFRLRVINPGSSNLRISFQLYRGVGEDIKVRAVTFTQDNHSTVHNSNPNFNYLAKPNAFNVNVLQNRLHLTTRDDSLISDLGKNA